MGAAGQWRMDAQNRQTWQQKKAAFSAAFLL